MNALTPTSTAKPAFDAAEHAAGENQLIVGSLFEIVPDAQARGFGVREQHVAFHLFAAVDHDIDHIAALDGYFTGRGLKLLDGNNAFRLVSEIDNDVFGGNAEHRALDHFVGCRGGKLTVIFEQVLVTLGDRRVHLPVVLVYGHSASTAD